MKSETSVQNLTFSEGCCSEMAMCWCGDVFRASGASEDVRAKRKTWEALHINCGEQKREGTKLFWLSFCDADRPVGQQFLGACIVEVTAAEADEMALEVMLRFPLAQSGAEWIGAASRKAHQMGCNPGGEMMSAEIPADAPEVALYPKHVLLSKAQLKAIAPIVNMNTGDPE